MNLSKYNLIPCLSGSEIKKVYVEMFGEIANTAWIETDEKVDIKKFSYLINKEYVKDSDKYEIYSHNDKGEITQYTVIIDPHDSNTTSRNYSKEIIVTEESQLTLYTRELTMSPVIKDVFNKCIIETAEKGVLSMVSCSDGEYYLANGKIKNMDIDIDLLYNDGFKEACEKTVNFLKNEESGLIIWHGEKGTGKTSGTGLCKRTCSHADKHAA